MRRHIARAAAAAAIAAALVFGSAVSALACGGLIAPNGTISLTRTTTLAAYHDGIEHYLTSFEFAGRRRRASDRSSPLPGVPTKGRSRAATGRCSASSSRCSRRHVRRADVRSATRAPAPAPTVLLRDADRRARHHGAQGRRGRGRGLGARARLLPAAGRARGARLLRRAQPDLHGHAVQRRSAPPRRASASGDGTPVHVVIPTADPWVPLRILALGQQADDLVQADVFLLTDREPGDAAAGRSRRTAVPTRPA